MTDDDTADIDIADIDQLRSVAQQLATEAAEFVRARRPEVFGTRQSGAAAVRAKSTPTDPVTVVDTETETLLRDRLAQLRPGEPVVGEEGGGPRHPPGGRGEESVCWVLDPIDGTVNFVYAIPAYAVSVAAQVGGVSLAGAVADVTADRVYSAGLGLGSHVTDGSGSREELHCNDIDELNMALIGTGFGYAPARRAAQAAVLAQLLPGVRDIRRIGSAALDLCMVAAGRLDAHYEFGLKLWDWAAGALIAAEAGARVQVPPAGADGLTVAAAPGIAGALITELTRFGAHDAP